LEPVGYRRVASVTFGPWSSSLLRKRKHKAICGKGFLRSFSIADIYIYLRAMTELGKVLLSLKLQGESTGR
jgi:hypothetical protein